MSKIITESTKFVIRKYVGVHSCLLLNRNANHRQATYVVIGEQVAPQYIDVEKGHSPKGIQTFACKELGARSTNQLLQSLEGEKTCSHPY